MDSVFLGKEIKRVRKEIGLTQYELADGICGQSEISKIERGSVFPTMEVLAPISDRLKKPVSYWFEAAISDQYYHVEKLKKEVHQLLNEHRYEEAYSISRMELEKRYLSGEHKQFFDWALTISGYKINKIWLNSCIQKIESLLNQKFFYMDTNQTMYIRNSLAYLYRNVGETKACYEEYEKILSNNNYVNNIRFLIKVMCNYANTLHSDKQFEKSLEIVNRALKVAKDTQELGNSGNLYFLKGECLIDLNQDPNEISICFEKALFFFKEFGREDYIEILYTTFSQYINI